MENFERKVFLAVFIGVLLFEFFNIYTRLNDNNKIQELSQKVEQQQIELDKIQYAFENRQKLDTIIININNNNKSIQKMDTLNVKFFK